MRDSNIIHWGSCVGVDWDFWHCIMDVAVGVHGNRLMILDCEIPTAAVVQLHAKLTCTSK